MAAIVFEGVGKRYDDGFVAIDNLDLVVNDGEFLVLVGPSGCGKSTALRIIAGLEDISFGRVLIDGVVANDLAPRDRDIAMVFQSYALYPHLSVAENIGFGLKVRGGSRAEIDRKVRETAHLLELEDYLDRKPSKLSGGQRQRVAMGRALVREPKAFLMDEPLSNLDARLRGQMRTEIARLQKLTGVTTVYVTHDQVEAMTMGDRVAVMKGGVIQQLGSPREIYDRPANLFVAGFIGSPSMNFLRARVDLWDEELVVEAGGLRLRLAPEALVSCPSVRAYIGQAVVLGIRPEVLTVTEPAEGCLNARVTFIEDLGALQLVHLEMETATGIAAPAIEEDDVTIFAPHPRILVERSRHVAVGDHLALTADSKAVHLFDARTSTVIRG